MSLLYCGPAEALPPGAERCATPPAGPHLIHLDGRYHLADGAGRHQPLTIDFRSAFYRARGGTEYLPRAFRGLSDIGDGTAGWGRDAWLLHYRGFRLTLYERNPYLQLLLRQGLAELDEPRPELVAGDVAEVGRRHEAIYLDPMFPPRRKSAAVGREMQALHQLVAAPSPVEEAQLLAAARARAEKRVVVKRPKGAPPLAGLAPDFAIGAPNTRYDVYLV